MTQKVPLLLSVSIQGRLDECVFNLDSGLLFLDYVQQMSY